MLAEMTTANWIALAAATVGAVGVIVAILTYFRRKKPGSDDVAERIVRAQASQLLQSGEEIGRLKTDLAAAMRRAEAAEARGDRPEAAEILEKLRESNDTTRLQELLITDRDARKDALIDRNREIAAVAYLRGDIPTATKALDQILALAPDDMSALIRKGHIQDLTGQLDDAESSYKRVLELAQGTSDWRPAALSNLGRIYRTRGNLNRAEEMFSNAFKIYEEVGCIAGMGAAYVNFGIIHHTRGDLDHAEKMHIKALDIYIKNGQLEGMATVYGNLGGIYQTRGDLDIIYRKRGDLDRAEMMLIKALEINEKLGRLEGTANQYGNLGLIYRIRGDLGRARGYGQKALALFEQIGMAPEIEKTRGWLDGLD